MRYVYLVLAFIVVLVVSAFGFRGHLFTSPPLDVFPEWAFPGMKYQPKYRPQSASPLFADGRADRPIPAHTVARGDLRADDALHRGGTPIAGSQDLNYVSAFPASLTLDQRFLERGQERYQIYCAPCHGLTGDGNGVTKGYGMNAPSLFDERRRGLPVGQIYNVITRGMGLMMPYADKLAVEDRWAVVAYVQALQRAQAGTPADLTSPADRQKLGLQ